MRSFEDGGFCFAVAGDVAAAHCRGVEFHNDVAVRVDADDAAGAAGRLEHGLHYIARGLGQALLLVGHARRDVMGDGVPDEVFAVAGAGDAGGAVVGIGAGTDDRRVADAAEAFAGHPAGGGTGGEVALGI